MVGDNVLLLESLNKTICRGWWWWRRRSCGGLGWHGSLMLNGRLINQFILIVVRLGRRHEVELRGHLGQDFFDLLLLLRLGFNLSGDRLLVVGDWLLG